MIILMNADGKEISNQSRGRGRRLLIPMALLSQHRALSAPRVILSRDRGQSNAMAFESIMPQHVARERIEAVDFAVTTR